MKNKSKEDRTEEGKRRRKRAWAKQGTGEDEGGTEEHRQEGSWSTKVESWRSRIKE